MTETIALGPDSGVLQVKTSRAGVAAKVGHDLTLEARSWEGEAIIDAQHPESSTVRVEVQVDSLTIAEATGGVKPLSEGDERDIYRNIAAKILHTDTYPTITYVGAFASGDESAFTLDGELTVMDRTEPLTVRGSLSGGRAKGTATVAQNRWGIKPFSALFGTLKLADEVTVEFDLAVESGGPGA